MTLDFFRIIFNSWPAMASIPLTVLIILSRKEIRKKIDDLTNFGGKRGLNWPGENSPKNSLSKIKHEKETADEEIRQLKSQRDELVKLALSLNKELEETKIELFFESLIGAMVNWQYFMLKIGCEVNGKTLTIAQLVYRIRSYYKDYDNYVTYEYFCATLDDLKKYGFLEIIKPYTNETPIIFKDICKKFVFYVDSRGIIK